LEGDTNTPSRLAVAYAQLWGGLETKCLRNVNYVLLFEKAASGIPIDRPKGAQETFVQQEWTNAACKISDTRVRLADRHGTPTLGEFKPDMVMYTRTSSPSDASTPVDAIEGIIELKSDLVNLAENEYLGQAVTYGREVLELHPFRAFVYVFLANSTQIIALRVEQDAVYYTSAMPLSEGTPWLRGMLTQSEEQLGSQPLPRLVVNNVFVIPEKYIGRGRSSAAYSAKIGASATERVVYKRFFKKEAEAFKAEWTMLSSDALKPLAAEIRVPMIIASLAADQVLVISPFAKQFRRQSSSTAPLMQGSFLTMYKSAHFHRPASTAFD
jgi:hypothetical protein